MVDRAMMPDDLHAALDAARARLGPFASLRYLPEVESTNDVALSLAATGAPDGTAVLADTQTAGRGRRGRAWHSPPASGLYLSVVLEAGELLPALSVVTLAAGVAAAEAVRAASGLPVELKWPNDLVIGRPWRKLGGILCESSGAGGQLEAIVVGIGINLRPAAFPPEVAAIATSIEAELGRAADRSVLVVELLAALRGAMTTLRAGRTDDVCRRWRAFAQAGLGGAVVHWQDGDVVARGVAHDIAEDGALLVERRDEREAAAGESGGALARREMVRMVAGEVKWERLSRE
jgi:BirA family biotin operon repressor/biotin-[acetyl-CoA-carboxylase] ligase